MFGWDDIAMAVAPSVISGFMGSEGQSATNQANANINNAQQAFNATEAEKSRGFQAEQAETNRNFQSNMRSTQYQTAVGDLKAAGLNPMLAYTNGGAGNLSGAMASGAQATSGAQIPMQNKMAAGLNAAQATANIENTKAQTELTETQAQKLGGVDTENVQADTGQKTANTANITKTLGKIDEEIKNIKMDTLTKEEQVTLIRAQQQLTNVNKELANKNISNVEAMTAGHKIINTLKNLEIPGAKNLADYEKMLDTGGGNAGRALGAVSNTALTIRRALGK